jgi:hypothetical protein
MARRDFLHGVTPVPDKNRPTVSIHYKPVCQNAVVPDEGIAQPGFQLVVVEGNGNRLLIFNGRPHGTTFDAYPIAVVENKKRLYRFREIRHTVFH